MSPEEAVGNLCRRQSSALMWCFGELQLSALGHRKGLGGFSLYPIPKTPPLIPQKPWDPKASRTTFCAPPSLPPTIPETPQAPFIE